MITIKQFIFNPVQVNTYILHDETKNCIIIDAGCFTKEEEQNIVNYIEKKQLVVNKLVQTHGHFDHILGNNFLSQKYKLPLYAHKNAEKFIKNLVNHAKLYNFEVQESIPISNYLEEGDSLNFGNSELKVIHVPGHSPGSLVYYSVESSFAIVGDVLFKGSIGRTDLEDGDLDLLLDGIYKKLYTLPEETTIFPGHGPSTTISYEKASNPFT